MYIKILYVLRRSLLMNVCLMQKWPPGSDHHHHQQHQWVYQSRSGDSRISILPAHSCRNTSDWSRSDIYGVPQNTNFNTKNSHPYSSWLGYQDKINLLAILFMWRVMGLCEFIATWALGNTPSHPRHPDSCVQCPQGVIIMRSASKFIWYHQKQRCTFLLASVPFIDDYKFKAEPPQQSCVYRPQCETNLFELELKLVYA